ncbi:hypothetical protein [Streptomyces sp. T028]|uniref:hypothetical protein n=1 Tax=Streptomyces sp. T028 TaxID=3394379 RepID=UPI003A8BDFDE
MDPLVVAAGTALVGAMASDAWQEARNGVTTLWRRFRPEQAEVIDGDLVETREQMTAGEAEDDAVRTARALAVTWQLRLQALLRENPSMAGDLQRLLDTRFAVTPADDERPDTTAVTMNAEASGHGRVYQAGRDQHITER